MATSNKPKETNAEMKYSFLPIEMRAGLDASSAGQPLPAPGRNFSLPRSRPVILPNVDDPVEYLAPPALGRGGNPSKLRSTLSTEENSPAPHVQPGAKHLHREAVLPEKLYTIQEAAELLNIHAWKLRRALKKELIPCHRLLNSRRLVRISGIEAAIRIGDRS